MKFNILFFSLLCINYFCTAQMIPVEGVLFGRPINTEVDHELAKTMLTNTADSSVIRLFSHYNDLELTTENLSIITENYSFDVATLFFLKTLYEQEENKQIQDFYLNVIDTLSLENAKYSLTFLKDYFIAFVPGFRYEHIDNGGDFLQQRILFDAAGIEYELIRIDGTGRVQPNAEIVANRLNELNKIHKNIIIISVSKGGLETAIALGELLDHDNASSIKAWLNVGGILKGTPVADRWSKPFMRFWMACGLFMVRIKVELKGLLNEMSYELGKERYKSFDIPSHIYTVNLIAASLGKEQPKKNVFTSPNDSFSPLADAITEDGVVVVEMGKDHYFRNIDLNVRMVALLHYIVNQLK